MVTATEREIAVSADGSTIVAGDPTNASGGTGQGAFYVFVRSGKRWRSGHETRFFPGGRQPGDQQYGTPLDELGDTVATSGNGAVIVASVPGYHSNPQNGEIIDGLEAIYVRAPGGWGATNPAPVARIFAPNDDPIGSAAISRAGSTIVIAGSTNVILANEPPGGWAAGQPTSQSLAPSTGQLQGIWNLAISPDAGTILVGATNDVAYVFSRTGQEAAFTPPHGSGPKQMAPQFGLNVALAGRLAVVTTDGGGADRLFVRRGSRWSNQAGGKAILIKGETIDTASPVALSDSGQLVVSELGLSGHVVVLQARG